MSEQLRNLKVCKHSVKSKKRRFESVMNLKISGGI
jgi:hypothetical protein